MLAFLPPIYPDELLYSFCARYHERMGYQSKESTCRDLFGKERVKVAFDFPSNLATLVKCVPFKNWWTVDQLIDQHTLFPFYAPFAPSIRVAQIRADMRYDKGGAIHARLGALTHRARPKNLRFCRMCIDVDRATFEETYWHRIHNVPGVEVCATHQIFLDNSSVRTAWRSNHEMFSTAERVIDLKPPRPLKSDQATLVKLASDAQWLLNHPGISSEPDVTLNRYLRLLFDENFATHTGMVRHTKLARAFLEFYSADLLHSLGSELNYESTWLRRIVQEPIRSSTQSPIHHLLLMNFLACPINRFFSLPHTSVEPFGSGPWPCLNRVADHFRQPVVKACEIRLANGKPLGTFACDCGFVYCRFGPDRDEDSSFQYHRTKSYGQVWYSNLKKLCLSQRRTKEEIASQLGISEYILLRELGNLKKLDEAPKRGTHSLSKKTKRIHTTRLKNFRSRWLLAVQQHPTLHRSKLKDVTGYTVYKTLSKQDRKWFEANSPPPVTPPGPTSRTNWALRDIELAALARASADKITSAPGRPVRASATAIARALGVLEVIHKRTGLLPLTIDAISGAAESVVDFALRRSLKALDCFEKERIRPTLFKLQIRAGVSPKVWRDLKLEETVALSKESLSKRNRAP